MAKTKASENEGGAAVAELPEAERANLLLADICESRTNPRKTFDILELNGLADNIKSNGVIVPLLVRPLEIEDTFGAHSYEIIDGARRFRAAEIAGLTEVPCIVREATELEAMILQVICNRERADVPPLEEAAAFQALLDAGEFDVNALSKHVHVSASQIYTRLKLLELPERIRNGLRDGLITSGHAEKIVRLDHEEARMQAFHRCIDEELSVRALGEMIEREFKLKLDADEFEPKDDSKADPADVENERQAQKNDGETERRGDGENDGDENFERDHGAAPEENHPAHEVYGGKPLNNRDGDTEKLQADLKFETGVRHRIFKRLLKSFSELDCEFVADKFLGHEQDYFEESVEVAKLFGFDNNLAFAEAIRKDTFQGYDMMQIIFAIENSGLLLADEVSLKSGRPPMLYDFAKKTGVDIADCEREEHDAIAGLKPKARKNLASPASGGRDARAPKPAPKKNPKLKDVIDKNKAKSKPKAKKKK